MTVPVVMLHALAPDSVMWAEQRRVLARAGHHVLTPDQRGYGTTPLGAEPPSLAVVADDIARMLDEDGIGEVVLVAASMGGYVAMELLRRHPGRVSGLALLSTRAARDDETAVAGRHAFAKAVVDPVLGPDVVRSAVPGLVGATTRTERPEVLARVQALTETIALRTLAWAQRAIAARADSFDVLAATDVPAVVIAGDEDELVPRAEPAAMTDALPDGTLVTVPAAGHLTPIEAPDPVTRALTDLLERVGGRPC